MICRMGPSWYSRTGSVVPTGAKRMLFCGLVSIVLFPFYGVYLCLGGAHADGCFDADAAPVGVLCEECGDASEHVGAFECESEAAAECRDALVFEVEFVHLEFVVGDPCVVGELVDDVVFFEGDGV